MNTDHIPSLAAPAQLAPFLRDHLVRDIVPFWMKHAIDPAGGINSCIRDDGGVVSRDKWGWSQWRAVWVFSQLYRLIEPRPEWLDTAHHIYNFMARHGQLGDSDSLGDKAGRWALLLDGEGQVLRRAESIYTDAFAIYGAVALANAHRAAAHAQGSRPAAAELHTSPIDLAIRTADHALRVIQRPHDQIPHFPYPVPKGAHVHGIPMIFSLVFWELGELLNENRYRDAAIALSDQCFDLFYRPDVDLMVERVSPDGSEYPGPLGSAVIPGHVVEDMWFQIHIALDRRDQSRIDRAVALIRRHIEFGWDDEHGGLFLARDAHGGSEVGWNFADTKLWWPQTEALYALTLAHELTGESWCVAWFDSVLKYCLDHYPVEGHGEWRQRLDRLGRPINDVVALPVKDPFHLPRVLIYCIKSLERSASAKTNPQAHHPRSQP